MRKNTVMMILAVLMVLAGYAIANAQEDKEAIKTTLNQLGAQVALLDQQIKGMLEKRQELNRLIGNGQRRLFEIQEAEKAQAPEPPEPKE